MMNAMVIDEKDNVAVAIEEIKKGEQVVYLDKSVREHTLTTVTDIPIYHKMAVTEIKKGSPVVKYGEHIGLAALDIHIGEHIHVHNVESHRENL